MGSSVRLQLLTCLMVYASCAHAIMVTFGTKGGPIEPLTPESTVVPPQHYSTGSPAPVWEERSYDKPDPNAQWRPQLFVPQPRYTQIVYNVPPPTPTLTNAQRFVNSYAPTRLHQPIKAEPVQNYFSPAQILSSQSLPGYGIRYFVPTYLDQLQRKEGVEDNKLNQIDSHVNEPRRESANEVQWQYEKDASKRIIRHTVPVRPLPYQFPAYVPPRHQ